MRTLLCAACAAAMFIGAGGVANGEENTGYIYGRVVLEGARRPVCPITVRLLSNREPDREIRTQSDGSFQFLGVFPGDVTVVVGRRLSRVVDVHANLESDATFYSRNSAVCSRTASR